MVREEAGDCLLRSFDRNFRRSLCGTITWIERHGTAAMVFFAKLAGGLPVHADIFLMASSLANETKR